MSRPSHLPPRCPFQRKPISRPNREPSSLSPPKVNDSNTRITRHHKSLSQSSTLSDQPAWFDDLLSDSDLSPKGSFHYRSSSGPANLFDRFVPNIAVSLSKKEEHLAYNEGRNTLESSCIYGPNSPRKKSNVEFSDSSLLLSLTGYVSQSPNHYVEDISQGYKIGGDCGSQNELNNEPKTGKRHPGQRSRARKLQYIAELERTVNVFQALESELAIRISTLLQQKVILSLENSKLKQQMARLQQRKLLMDGEYQSLRKEADRLKHGLVGSIGSKVQGYGASSDTDDHREIPWQMLDWNKLHL